MDAKGVLDLIKKEGIVQVDLRFMDFPGMWQHCTYPVSEFKDDSPFTEGLGFDGSSIRGWQGINESDMLLMPDPSTAVIDPFTQ
ncbi:MAG: glutamine synthetase beta-grasp domain-containing protein, partial [Brevinematales bacterium]